jgi:hypothetical protein
MHLYKSCKVSHLDSILQDKLITKKLNISYVFFESV